MARKAVGTSKKVGRPKALAVSSRRRASQIKKVSIEDALHESTVRPIANRRRAIILGILIVALGLLAFLAYKALVVGWVDRTPVTRIELYKQLEARYGKDLTEQIITETLINNEARNRNIEVTQGEIDAEMSKLEQQQGGSEQLDQILSFQGLTRDELKRQMSFQLLIKKMFGQGTSVSDEEVSQYIETNKDLLGEVDASAAASIKDQLIMQKISESFNTWLTESREGKRVVRL